MRGKSRQDQKDRLMWFTVWSGFLFCFVLFLNFQKIFPVRLNTAKVRGENELIRDGRCQAAHQSRPRLRLTCLKPQSLGLIYSQRGNSTSFHVNHCGLLKNLLSRAKGKTFRLTSLNLISWKLPPSDEWRKQRVSWTTKEAPRGAQVFSNEIPFDSLKSSCRKSPGLEFRKTKARSCWFNGG